MLRMSKLTDYSIVILAHVAAGPAGTTFTARTLATSSGLPLPTVGKVLKALCRGGLLTSQRGARGGYRLSRGPDQISVLDVIAVLEGPVAVTACSRPAAGAVCDIEAACPVRSNWRLINDRVVAALGDLTLAEMTTPIPASPVTHHALSLAAPHRPQQGTIDEH